MSERRRLRVGLIGFGAFGRFAASHLRHEVDLVVCDREDCSEDAHALGVAWGDLATVASCSVVVVAVPVPSLESVLESIAPLLRPGALVVDVASVKMRPIELLARLLPASVDWVGTHPMFGPQSGRNGIAGLKVALCAPRARRERLVRRFLERRYGLDVLPMTAERHDHEIAYIQGLTHWVAKALREIELPDPRLATTAYRHLLAIEEILRDDSDALFLTIQRDNPFVGEARHALMRRLLEIEHWIEQPGRAAEKEREAK
jgi:prephenate dehydrogenase